MGINFFKIVLVLFLVRETFNLKNGNFPKWKKPSLLQFPSLIMTDYRIDIYSDDL